MTYSNRYQILQPLDEVYFEQNTVFVTANDVSFALPLNTLTERLSADPDIEYLLEYHTATQLLAGIKEVGGSHLYRMQDEFLYQLARTPAHLNRLFRDGRTLDPEEVLLDMLGQLTPNLKSRLKSLPKDYLDQYLIYELKVSYLASSPVKPYLFDPTQQELSTAMGLALSNDPAFPQLIPYSTS